MRSLFLILTSLFLIGCSLVLKNFAYSNDINVTENTDLSLRSISDKIIKDLKPYYKFIKINKRFSRPISKKILFDAIGKIRGDFNNDDDIIEQKDLKKIVIDGLNVDFLLMDINQRPLIVTTVSLKEFDTYIEKELLFKDKNIGIFHVLFLIPKYNKEPLPAIIGLHGHGESNSIFKNKYFAVELAKGGFAVIMPYFRAMESVKEDVNVSIKLLLNGFTLMGIRCYETLLVLKYLKYSKIIDSSRIGIIGHSGGSTIAGLVGAISNDFRCMVIDCEISCRDIFDDLFRHPYYTHCQTIPFLAKYCSQIDIVVPFLDCEYGYGYGEGREDRIREKVINFFTKYLKI